MWRKSQRRRQNPRAAPPKSPVHSTALLVPTMFRRQSSATKSWLVLKCNFLAGFEAQSDTVLLPVNLDGPIFCNFWSFADGEESVEKSSSRSVERRVLLLERCV